MRAFKELTSKEKQVVKEFVLDRNMRTAGRGLLGFNVKKLTPSKENKKKFQEQFDGHSLCGCYSCMQIAKTFINSNQTIKEEVITESMKDLDQIRVK